MVKGPPANRTMVCTCNDVTDDQFNRKGKSFKNIKDGEGSCECEINNDRSGKRTKKTKVNSVLLAQRTKRK